MKLELAAEYILDELERLKSKPKFRELIKRNIQVIIYDKTQTKGFWTGKITQAALDSGKKPNQCSKEHWYGLTQLALDIIEMENPTKEKILYEIQTKGTFNYTTSEENRILKHNNQNYELVSELVTL